MEAILNFALWLVDNHPLLFVASGFAIGLAWRGVEHFIVEYL